MVLKHCKYYIQIKKDGNENHETKPESISKKTGKQQKPHSQWPKERRPTTCSFHIFFFAIIKVCTHKAERKA